MIEYKTNIRYNNSNGDDTLNIKGAFINEDKKEIKTKSAAVFPDIAHWGFNHFAAGNFFGICIKAV